MSKRKILFCRCETTAEVLKGENTTTPHLQHIDLRSSVWSGTTQQYQYVCLSHYRVRRERRELVYQLYLSTMSKSVCFISLPSTIYIL